MTLIESKLQAFCSLVEQQQRNRFAADYPGPMLAERMAQDCSTHFHIGKRWARVDVGTSGKYMVDMTTQEIVGIKAYGVPHLGHHYGTLDSIADWDWSGYHAVPAAPTTYAAIPQDTTAIG